MSKGIRDKVAVVGVGCCKFGENWHQSPEDMIVEAAYEAYADAGLEDPQAQIDAVFCGSVYPSRGTAEVAESLKLFDRPVSLVQNYCATGTDAPRSIGAAIHAGGSNDPALSSSLRPFVGICRVRVSCRRRARVDRATRGAATHCGR